jgi:putative hydrolase of the HAD superfamily
MIIVFDLSGVFFNKNLKVSFKKISKKYDLNPKKVEFVLNGSFSREYRTGLTKPKDYWKKVKKYLKVERIEEIRKILFDSYYPSKRAVELIKKLRMEKAQVAFLSNGPKDRMKYLDKKFKFIRLFDFGLFSFEAGICKPDKRIYEKFLEKFKLKSTGVTYIDDKKKNLRPAKELGMKTILFKDIKQLKRNIARTNKNSNLIS